MLIKKGIDFENERCEYIIRIVPVSVKVQPKRPIGDVVIWGYKKSILW